MCWSVLVRENVAWLGSAAFCSQPATSHFQPEAFTQKLAYSWNRQFANLMVCVCVCVCNNTHSLDWSGVCKLTNAIWKNLIEGNIVHCCQPLTQCASASCRLSVDWWICRSVLGWAQRSEHVLDMFSLRAFHRRPTGDPLPSCPDEFSSKGYKTQVALYVYVAEMGASNPHSHV